MTKIFIQLSLILALLIGFDHEINADPPIQRLNGRIQTHPILIDSQKIDVNKPRQVSVITSHFKTLRPDSIEYFFTVETRSKNLKEAFQSLGLILKDLTTLLKSKKINASFYQFSPAVFNKMSTIKQAGAEKLFICQSDLSLKAVGNADLKNIILKILQFDEIILKKSILTSTRFDVEQQHVIDELMKSAKQKALDIVKAEKVSLGRVLYIEEINKNSTDHIVLDMTTPEKTNKGRKLLTIDLKFRVTYEIK